MTGKTANPGRLGNQPAGKAGNGDTQQQKWHGLNQQALKNGPSRCQTRHSAQGTSAATVVGVLNNVGIIVCNVDISATEQ